MPHPRVLCIDEQTMGAASSCHETLQKMCEAVQKEQRQHPIETMNSFEVDGRVFVVVGETHTDKKDYEAHPFRDFLRDQCMDTSCSFDFFIEEGYTNRFLYSRIVPEFQSQRQIDALAGKQADSLGVARVQGLRTCLNFRNHVIDVRPNTFKLLAEAHTKRVFAQGEQAKYAHLIAIDTLHETAGRVDKKVTQYIKQMPDSPIKTVAKAYCDDILQECYDAGPESSSADWRYLASRLVDLYAFCRMARPDNSHFCITYCGEYHATFLTGMFSQVVGLSDNGRHLTNWRKRSQKDLIPPVLVENFNADHAFIKAQLHNS